MLTNVFFCNIIFCVNICCTAYIIARFNNAFSSSTLSIEMTTGVTKISNAEFLLLRTKGLQQTSVISRHFLEFGGKAHGAYTTDKKSIECVRVFI